MTTLRSASVVAAFVLTLVLVPLLFPGGGRAERSVTSVAAGAAATDPESSVPDLSLLRFTPSTAVASALSVAALATAAAPPAIAAADVAVPTSTTATAAGDGNATGAEQAGNGHAHAEERTSSTTAPPPTTAPATTAPATTAPPPPTTTIPPAPAEGEAAPATSQTQEGKASWYDLEGAEPGVCAHRTLPFDTVVKVTNVSDGKAITCTVGDRGPYVDGRIVDLFKDDFAKLASISAGVIDVRLEW